MEKENEALARVTINACNNILRSPWRRRIVVHNAAAEQPSFQPEAGGVLEKVQRLPVRFGMLLLLGLDTKEIGCLTGWIVH